MDPCIVDLRDFCGLRIWTFHIAKDPGNPVNEIAGASQLGGDPWTLWNPAPCLVFLAQGGYGHESQRENRISRRPSFQKRPVRDWMGQSMARDCQPDPPIAGWFGFSGGPRFLLLIPF